MELKIYKPSQSYGDNLAQKKRRHFFIWLSAVLTVLVLLSGFIFYALFYSGWMDITSISINGLKTLTADQVLPGISSAIEEEILPILHIKYQKNAFFFNPERIRADILSQFQVIKEVSVIKNYPHSISINITERTPIGTWCFTDGCSYFDDEGALWGKALKSSGSLLLTVEDNRVYAGQQKAIDKDFFENIKKAVAGLGDLNIKISKVVILADSITDFQIYTVRGYYIIFTVESDIAKQIEVLKIFLNEKGQNFRAGYIDLRIEGRVYYK